MMNHNDQSNARGSDSGLAQTMSTGRRRFLQAAGIGATSLTGFGGLAAGQSDDNVIQLEAVNIEAGGGRGRGEYVWEDGEVQGPPDNVCNYEQGNHVWVGVSPDAIDGQTNPTLDLTAGESYTVEWTNTTGDAHNFVIVDADGNEILASDEISEEGATQSVEFTATDEMAEYYCAPHSGSQRGEVAVGDGGGPMPGPDEVNLMLVFVTKGYSHRNIPYGVDKIKGLSDRIAAETGANSVNIDTVPEEVPDDVTETKPDDSSAFPTDASELEQYDAIIWFSTTGDVLDDPAQRDAFEEYMRNGGGYAGIHAAGDTHHPGDGEWDFYLGMHGGAYFTGHPENQDAEIHVTDQVHPSTDHLPASWEAYDEWYDYSESPRGEVHVLATLDETSYDGAAMENGREDHPISWCQEYQGGRVWYTGRGHTEESFDEDAFIDHVLGGILWAGGFEEGDASGTVWDSYDREVLVDGLSEPMKMDIDADGRIFFTERTTGNLKILDSDTGETTTAMTLDVYTGQEDGMQGVALDPDFEDNGWLYLYYSPAGDESVNRLSRFTVDGDSIDPATETQMLDVDTQRETCCHTGGDLEFDTQGNLYLTTGDDTNPFESSGYTPIDERDGREPFDAQRTSANTNDLRGSVLRITPQDDGSYTIPDDNLFTEANGYGDALADNLARPEIYGMGFRNPFTAAIDPETDEAWVGDYGPDAGGWDADRGPMGTVEYAKVADPGFYGWPYFTGHSVPYKDYDFETGESGEIFDPENPINDSVNNTGLEELPAAQGTSIMSPYNWGGYLDYPSEWEEYVPYSSMDEVPFPEITGGAAMVGTVYRHNTAFGDGSLAKSMDGKIFIMEYGSGWIKYISLDDDGEVMEVDPFLPDEDWGSPFDMNVGPDGALYFIDYGGSISKITGGGASTAASVSVSVESDEILPEESTTATVEIENISGSELSDLEFSLTAGNDVLQVTSPSTTTFDSLAAGSSQPVEFEVAAGADATEGTYALDAEVTFTHEGEEKASSGSATISVPQTVVEAPYGANLGGSPPAESGATTPAVIDGLEFMPAGTVEALQPVTVTGDTPPGDPDWFTPPAQAGGPTTDSISNTEHDAIYQTELIGYNLGFEVPIPNGIYDVTLHNAEIYFEEEGQRVFDVSVQDQKVVEGLDLYAEAGHDVAWTKTVEDVEVTDGTLTISTTTQSDFSKLAGIEIRYSEPLQNGLEAYFSLDGDTPVNQVTGTEASVVGEPTSGQPGFRNNAWEFGTNGTIDTVDSTVVSEPLPLNGEGATVGAWINHDAITEDYSRVYHVDDGGSPDSPTNGWNIEFGGTDNTVAHQFWNGGEIGAEGQPSVSCPAGEWVFVVTVVEGNDATIYTFDEEGQIASGSGGGDRTQSDLAQLLLMAGDGRDTPGLMDEVWAYSRALSESEVDRLYNQSFQGLDGDNGGGNESPTTFELRGEIGGWVGLAPSSIEGQTNPTLTLQEGETYKVGWTEGDSLGHNIEIRDADGNVVDDLETEVTTDPGDGQWLTFTASSEMAEYVCDPHESLMVGDIEVV